MDEDEDAAQIRSAFKRLALKWSVRPPRLAVVTGPARATFVSPATLGPILQSACVFECLSFLLMLKPLNPPACTARQISH